MTINAYIKNIKWNRKGKDRERKQKHNWEGESEIDRLIERQIDKHNPINAWSLKNYIKKCVIKNLVKVFIYFSYIKRVLKRNCVLPTKRNI